jgi:predicted lipoprotein with Yx(FWY)xxD motif
MRKSGWTVATGLGSLVLLLTACGGSSSSTTTTTGAPSGTATQNTASSGASTGSSSSSASSPNATATQSSPVPKDTSSADAQPSSNTGVTFPPVGTTVLIIQHSNLGWVMAKASGYVVYTYDKDKKGGPPTCTGSCASVWIPVTGMPKPGPPDNFPGTFSTITVGGKKVITYNGYPLYTYSGDHVLTTKGNGIDGVWHVIKLSESDITGG